MNRHAFDLDGDAHRVARGSGDGRHDGPRGPGKGVQQGRFPHVGTADYGDGRFVLFELAVGPVDLPVRLISVRLIFFARLRRLVFFVCAASW